MKQVIRKGLKDIVVDEVPDPVLLPHHVLVRPLYSLISSGTETASIHRDSLLGEVAGNPSHLRKIWDVAMKTGPMATSHILRRDRKSTRLNSSHRWISYAVFF